MKNRAAWRRWLAKHHAARTAVWLEYKKTGSGLPSIRYDEAVEEALCFGWIDSKIQPLNETSYRQYFTPRKPRSVWSKPNKARIERLLTAGLMQPAGLAMVERAKEDGSWNALDGVEDAEMGEDFARAMAAVPGVREFFDKLTAAVRRNTLNWIAAAKRPETRAKRIAAAVEACACGRKPV